MRSNKEHKHSASKLLNNPKIKVKKKMNTFHKNYIYIYIRFIILYYFINKKIKKGCDYSVIVVMNLSVINASFWNWEALFVE